MTHSRALAQLGPASRPGGAMMWGVAIAFLIIAVIAFFVFRADNALVEANRWTVHTYRVLTNLKSGEAAIRAAASDTRNYIFFGDSHYAASARESIEQTHAHLQTLREIAADNAEQIKRIDVLSAMIDQRVAGMQISLNRQDRATTEEIQDYLSRENSAIELTRIAEQFELIAHEETRLLQAREAAAERATVLSRIILLVGGGGAVLVLAAAVILWWREGSHRLLLEQHLRDAAVEARTAAAALAEANSRLEISNTGLETANRELEAFSYTVSHDLRAPLRSIDGFSRILLEEHASELSSSAARYLARVRNGAQQMGTLIDDLLAFSRLGRLPLKMHAVDLTALTQQIAEQLKDQNPDRNIEFVIDPLPPPMGDLATLRQVMTNLLTNAVKFTRTRDAARIHVGAVASNGEQRYFVRDNGVGFSMEYADKLFGVFQRLHRADEFEGTGVGLAIVQRIVHRHDGRVWAEGRPDEGATFWFTLPGEPLP